MRENKMHLVNKIFDNNQIRTIWNEENEKYYISIVDMIAVFTKSNRPRK